MLDYLKREPVRAYIYSVLAGLLALLVALDVIEAELADVLGAFAGTVLVVAGAETARSKVTPVG